MRAPAIKQVNEELLEEAAPKLDGIKVFSATKFREREALGDVITMWIQQHPEYRLLDKVVTQSSDAEFHCLTITVFYMVAKRPT